MLPFNVLGDVACQRYLPPDGRELEAKPGDRGSSDAIDHVHAQQYATNGMLTDMWDTRRAGA